MRYFLVGLPGSGKSHWGKIWSEKIKLPFFDLDDIIENNEGFPITEIFKSEGEDYFRNLESFYLEKLADNYQAMMLSTGGGTPCFNNNMELMNKKGSTIFLNPPLQLIAKRIWDPAKNTRPLFSHCNKQADIFNKLEQLKNKRFDYYNKATHHLKDWDETTIQALS
ncbi:shikimate kinase [Marivirga harenae]|uniref:shikimate kinase n=1 Tax=Marivirga harenae TaxID=2010992 RepID=UPI0026DF2C83|nr:shikimate kinase [Marivirga harenae]WKV10887.1 shikimate kinase [Marivirga harenae]|tara:strand:- start:172981 stop:173478 length:498 start_codon:yes stop_codon:yes gene_type:complete